MRVTPIVEVTAAQFAVVADMRRALGHADLRTLGRDLPLGTANVLAWELGIPLRPTGAAAVLAEGRTALLHEPAVYRAATTEAALKRTAMEEAKKAGRAVLPKDIGAEVERVLAAREVRETLVRDQSLEQPACFR